MADIQKFSKCYQCGKQEVLWSVSLKETNHYYGMALCKGCLQLEEGRDNVR